MGALLDEIERLAQSRVQRGCMLTGARIALESLLCRCGTEPGSQRDFNLPPGSKCDRCQRLAELSEGR